MTTNTIDYFNSQGPLRGLASRIVLRVCRDIYARFVALAGTEPGQRLLDLGMTSDTRLPNSNFVERWYSRCVDITMASIEDCTALEAVFPGTKLVRIQRDQALPFPDAYFDVGFCSAVLEHVGGVAQQRFVIQELLRMCRSVFLTTPDCAFPITCSGVSAILADCFQPFGLNR